MKVVDRILSIFILFTILRCFTTPAISLAQEEFKPTLAIIDLVPKGVLKTDAENATDRLWFEMFRTGAYDLIEREKIDEIFKEQKIWLTGACDNVCLADIGRTVNANKVLTGSVGKIEDMLVVSLRIVDVTTAIIEKSEYQECYGGLRELLTESVEKVAKRIAGIFPEAQTEAQLQEKPELLISTGDIYVKTEPPEAEIYFDGKKQKGSTPLLIERLSAGQYEVEARKEYCSSVSRKVEVIAGQIAKVDLALAMGSGSLKVSSDPFEAKLVLDGEQKGVTPIIIESIAAGPHDLHLSKEGYEDYEDRIIVEIDTVKEINASLRKSGELNKYRGLLSFGAGFGYFHVSGSYLGDYSATGGAYSMTVGILTPERKKRVLGVSIHHTAFECSYYEDFNGNFDAEVDNSSQQLTLGLTTVMLKVSHFLGRVQWAKIAGYCSWGGGYVLVEERQGIWELSRKEGYGLQLGGGLSALPFRADVNGYFLNPQGERYILGFVVRLIFTYQL